MKVCPTCQRKFDDADVFCPHDGGRLAAPQDLATIAPPDPAAMLAGVRSGSITAARVAPAPTPVPAAKETPVPRGTPVSAPPQGGYGGPADYSHFIGRVLDGRYKVEALLGEGGMGVVFKAHHTVIEKPVAIKLLKSEVAREESVVQRFLQEAKAASRIGHPNIVDVTDFGTLPDGSAYFVMEYISGKTLARVIHESAPMPMSRALLIIAQLARALSAAHGKGVVHRDLKPDNIFVIDRDGRRDIVKIVDFGIAKVAPMEGNLDGPRLTRVGSVFGTPEYMAPEQAAGRTDTDHRVDVYALGTIFYEMVVGHVPHRGESLVATLAMQMLDPITPPHQAGANIDVGIEAVIMNALAKERELRFESMSEFLGALEAASGAVPIDPLSGTGSVRAMATPRPTPAPAGWTPPPGTPPPGVPVAGAGGAGGKGPPSQPPPTLPESAASSGSMRLPRTIEDSPPAMPGPDTVRVAAPDDATLAPDPTTLSPFRKGFTPSPADASTLGPPAPRPAPAGPPPPVGPAQASTLRPHGPLPPPPGVMPPAPRPVPLLTPPERFAEPLPRDFSATSGLSPAARWALLVVLVLTSAAVAYVLLAPAKQDSDVAVAGGTADAGRGPVLVPPGQADAAVVGPDVADAGVVAIIEPDAGGRDPGPRPPRGQVTLLLHTEPRGGQFMLGERTVGLEGSRMTRPRGTKLTLVCIAPEHNAGHVNVVFDGKTDEIVCVMKRKNPCRKELKNPFEPCPD